MRWFQDALAANGLTGSVIAADLDEYSPARAFADQFILAPRVDDPEYDDWLISVLSDREISMAISINDFELSQWAVLPDAPEFAPLVRVSPETQRLVEDKYAMSEALGRYGVTSPRTWLGSSAPDGATERYVTKGRFGSASRGLRFTDLGGLDRAIESAVHEVTDRQGVAAYEQVALAPSDLVVVQEEVVGVEYGLDVVCDFEGTFSAVLARRKIAMRSGETDRAVSVDSAMFESIARGIALAVPHPGTFDVDVIVDSRGEPSVIDINPRFGGGYPFSHLAGARIPHAYVAWANGFSPQLEWLQSSAGAVGGKYVEAVVVP